jgi:uncharacterized protein (DUF1501 family)
MFFPPMRRPNRREFLGAGVVGTLGLALSPGFQRLLAAEKLNRRAKSCILIWLNGGPSHIDTFDPKPGADTNGPFQAIDTQTPGLKFSEHLPKLAAQSKNLTVIHSLTSREADHDRAYTFLHTGNQRSETVEYPSLGAVVAKEWTGEESDLPAFVSINGSSAGPGFFGIDYAPHVITDLNTPVPNVALPDGVSEERMLRRLRALEGLNRGASRRADGQRVDDQVRVTTRAARFRTSPALKAFDLSQEKPEALAVYGAQADDAVFAKSCVLARRLVENGVRFVEVMLDGWDTHSDNFNAVKALEDQLDPAFAGLVADLSDRGLLKETLVMCMGEFGRTPAINGAQGRDHWSDAFGVVLAGGGIQGGQFVGTTDDKGEQVKDRPVPVPDLYASLLAAFGVDGRKAYRTPEGRPIKLADKGTVVKELFS